MSEAKWLISMVRSGDPGSERKHAIFVKHANGSARLQLISTRLEINSEPRMRSRSRLYEKSLYKGDFNYAILYEETLGLNK